MFGGQKPQRAPPFRNWAFNPFYAAIEDLEPLPETAASLVKGVELKYSSVSLVGIQNVDEWPIVATERGAYRVAPRPIAPIAIGDAILVCQELGCELPDPALVDAIYEQANIWLDPIILKHDGTPKTMASPNAYSKHAALVLASLNKAAETTDIGPLALIVGTHKDIVSVNGKLGLYGWKTRNGRVIQPVFTGHGGYWIDYSQGVRPVKKIIVEDV